MLHIFCDGMSMQIENQYGANLRKTRYINPMKYAALFLCLITLSFPALAQTSDDMYVVRNVIVDITADNAVNARNNAFIKAQSQAYDQLLQQLKQPAGQPMPDDVTLGRMVKDFEIASEHVASNRYRGNFTFHFDPAQVQAFMGQNNNNTVATPAMPVPVPPPATPQVMQQTSSRQITMTIPFETLMEWRQIQAKLQQTGKVSQVTIYAMQYKKAEVRAMLLSSLPEVQNSLRTLGYTLEAQGTDHYLLRKGG